MRARGFLLGLILFFCSLPAFAEAVHTTDGRELAGKLTVLDAERAVVQAKDGQQTIQLSDIARILLADLPAEGLTARKGQHVVWTHDGCVLAVRDLVVRDGQVQAASDAAGRVALPLERVARILRPLAGETPDQLDQEARRLGLVPGKEDAIAVRSAKGGWVSMNGVFASLRDGQAAFTYEGNETTIKDETVAIIIPARPAKPDALPAARGRLTCTDGSRIPFTGVRLDANGLLVESASLGSLKLRRETVAELLFGTAQRTFLSDLSPTQPSQTPFFDEEFPWQKDRSITGQPLTLDGARYEKGLALHARCQLVYELGGAYKRLSAVAGIDGSLRAGKARLSLLADGKALVDRVLLDRLQPPQKLDLDLRGARQLTVLVDFAEATFGSGARVNLCDAALGK